VPYDFTGKYKHKQPLGNKANQEGVSQSEEDVTKTKKMLFTLGLMLASITILASARAGDQDQATNMTFNQPVQVPGRILPAGTYWFTLANVGTTPDEQVVRIFDSDRSTLVVTLLAIEVQPATPAVSTEVTLADRGPDQPKAIVSWLYPGSWYYPGFEYGHQFVYSRSEKQELARAKLETVTSGD